MLELSTNPNITVASTCPICHGVGQKVRVLGSDPGTILTTEELL